MVRRGRTRPQSIGVWHPVAPAGGEQKGTNKLMWPFSSKQRSRVAVVLHDGAAWHALVFAPAKPRPRLIARMTAGGQNPRDLPDGVLDFAEEHGARRIRLVMTQNVHPLRAELPTDAEAEEIQTAIAFEMMAETGGEADRLRVAATRAELLRMGAPSGMLLAAGFEQEMLEPYERTCLKAGLDFEGIAALELALLGAHAERRSEARLLFLRRDAGFYAVPGTELSPLSVGSLSLGVREDPREWEPERRERLVKRFALHPSVPLVVCCTPMPDAERREQLRSLLGDTVEPEFRDLETDIESLARQVAETPEPGVPAGGGALVGPRAPEKDPHRAGTWLFFLMLLAAACWTGQRWMGLRTERAILAERAKAWEQIQQERKSLQAKLDALNAERKGAEEATAILEVRTPLPEGLMPLLDALDRTMPEFTRVTSIEQSADGGWEIRGQTALQDRLTEMEKGLLEDLGKLGHSVEQRGLTRKEGTLEYEFHYRIGPKGKAAS